MPISIEWFLEKRILIVTYNGDVTAADLKEAGEAIRAAADQTEGQFLHSIADLSAIGKIPLNLKVITDATRGALSHPQFGWMAVYHMPNPVIQFFGDMATRVFQVRYRVFDEQVDALNFLNAVDGTLPPLRPIAEQRLKASL
jgi:hypothetical protein